MSQSDPKPQHLPLADFRPLADQAVYICFGSSHVGLRLQVAETVLPVISTFGTMLSATPSGASAGNVAAITHPEGIAIEVAGVVGSERFADPGAAVRELYHRVVMLLIAARPELLWVHSGVVAKSGQAVLLSAASGQGKSTLVAQLVARGWTYLSDEIAPIDPYAATVLPFPVMPYMRVSHRHDLPLAEVKELGKIPVELAEGAIATSAFPIAGIYFLSYAPSSGGVDLTPCSPAMAVVEMLRNSLNPHESRGKEIAGLCRLMEQTTCTHLRYVRADEAAEKIAQAHSSSGDSP